MLRNLLYVWLFPVLVWAQTPADHQLRQVPWLTDSVETPTRPVPIIRQLTKGGLNLPLLQQSSVNPSWLTVGINVTREHKLNRALALVGGLETNFSFASGARLYSLEVPVGLRYYFSLGQRMKKRADRHSFFSHYVALQTHNVLFANLRYDNESGRYSRMPYYDRGKFSNQVTNVGNYEEAFNLLEYAYFQIGSQVKLGLSNYLDINVALPISLLTKTEYTLITPALVTLKYGIAWQK